MVTADPYPYTNRFAIRTRQVMPRWVLWAFTAVGVFFLIWALLSLAWGAFSIAAATGIAIEVGLMGWTHQFDRRARDPQYNFAEIRPEGPVVAFFGSQATFPWPKVHSATVSGKHRWLWLWIGVRAPKGDHVDLEVTRVRGWWWPIAGFRKRTLMHLDLHEPERFVESIVSGVALS